MNFHVISKITGVIILMIALAMVPALLISLAMGEGGMSRAFIASILPLLVLGGVLILATKPLSTRLRMREGVFIVALCWILASALGALPYIFSGVIPGFIDAFFESAAGFSTTGATLLADLPGIPRGLMFWRSLSHWLGGMGILVFAISILPALGIGALNIAKAETTGPGLEKVTTRISDNAKFLYVIYFAFSVLEFLLLLLGKMNPYDAAIHMFGSMSTGGLSNYDKGIAEFNSPYIEFVVAFFCILASVSFIAYNELFHRRWREFFREPEVRAFFFILVASIAFIGVRLRISGIGDSAADSLRLAFLQVSAFITSSGYVSTDYAAWPMVCQWILLMLLFMGGCSSSTAGGIKIVRVLVLFRLIHRNFYKRLHPRAVVAVKLGGRTVSAENVSNITVFILMYFVVFLGSTLLLSLDGQDLGTTLSAAAARLSNNGVGFGKIGYGGTYDIFSAPARLFLSVLMILGRLELFTVLILLTPSYWRPNRQ
ncbi:MAG: TrkH family potassium uptake protein [Clostridiales Family XIII bacterium]|jgi:trk system potassium uptake protein TrkH|nr:TrkH family potassium uptake protein [Clostridiales Family XIII bacterium]